MNHIGYTDSEFLELNEKDKYEYFKQIINIVIAKKYPLINHSLKLDLEQECFLAFYKLKEDRIKPGGKKNFSFFYTIAFNKCMDKHKYIHNIISTRQKYLYPIEINTIEMDKKVQ